MIALSVLVLADRHPPSSFVDTVREAEAIGVEKLWTYDHLTWGGLKEAPWYAAMPLLAAAAAGTDTIRLGTQVATPNFRHPVGFAKEAMTLDQLSGGRFELGLGAGVVNGDALAQGDAPRSPREQADRFAEWVTLLDRLLTHEHTTWHGARYDAVDVRQLPGCVQRPRVPFTIAASGAQSMRVAARFGQAWVSYGRSGREQPPQQWYQTLADQGRRLDDAIVAAGRGVTEMRRIAQLALDVTWPFDSPERYRDVLGNLEAVGIDELALHWSRPDDGRGLPLTARDWVVATHQ